MSHIDQTNESAVDPSPSERVPQAVWLNRPTEERAPEPYPAKWLAGAILALAIVFIVDREPGSEAVRFVGPATAARAADPAAVGNGPTGYFPDRFVIDGTAVVDQPQPF